MTKNAYIHIPFCKSKCNYCSFVSFVDLENIEKYLFCLKREIKYFYANEKLNTLYFGGGTPSMLSAIQIKELLNLFNFEENAEITIELNPNDIDESYLENLLNMGVNRLSFGIQTFNDNILNIIGRRHNSKEAVNVVELAKKVGFNNVSIDLIYGLPNQTMADFKNDLEMAVTLPIAHLSFYGLKIDEGCKFYENLPENLPDTDIQADMYEFLCKFLKENNFEHYEISNFSKKGFNSRHNLNYWDNNSYYGFGISAHGYDGNIRYSNKNNFKDYFKNPLEHMTVSKLTLQQKLEEEIFLGFRKAEGIDIKNIDEKYNIDFENKYSDILLKYDEFFIKTVNGYAFNTRGFLISNSILSEFIDV